MQWTKKDEKIVLLLILTTNYLNFASAAAAVVCRFCRIQVFLLPFRL